MTNDSIAEGKFHGNDLEDRYVYERFDLPERGVFVDVGAGPDGIQGSNTYFFEQLGWTGVAIDGDPRNAKKLRKNRKCAYSNAISSKQGSFTYHMGTSPDLSGLKETPDNSHMMTTVATVTLESILEKEGIGKIDLMSIDTEGTEIDVFESFDFKKHAPTILIVEYLTQGMTNLDIVPYFTEKGYEYVETVGANYIFKLK